MIASTHLLKGIRFAHTIFRLLPPTPSHMGGGTHRSGFSSYEGASPRASRANERAVKLPSEFYCSFVPTAVGGRGCARGSTAAHCLVKGIRCAHAIYRLPPPTPSHMGGGTHRFGFSSYEGASPRASRANERAVKLPSEFYCCFCSDRRRRSWLRPAAARRRTAPKKEFAVLMLSKSPLPDPPLKGRGFCVAKVWKAA